MTSVLAPSVILTLESRNYKNTIIYGPDMNILYWIEQEGSKILGTNPIHVYRASLKGTRQEVAVMEFHSSKTDLVTYRDTTQKLKEMFPRRRWYSSCVIFFLVASFTIY